MLGVKASMSHVRVPSDDGVYTLIHSAMQLRVGQLDQSVQSLGCLYVKYDVASMVGF